MADIVYNNMGSTPEMQVKITFSTKRDKDKVTITAKVYERFIGGNTPPYDFPGGSSLGWCSSSTGLYTGWTLTFKMSSGNVSNTVVMKNNNNWMWSSEPSRTRTCSITITTKDNTAPVTCQITTSNNNYKAGTMPASAGKYTVTLPKFVAPTAPTWVSSNPNPCNINSAPTITWGGAKAGSMGVLKYDLDVRSSKPDGEWTSWVRLLAGKSGTSYSNTTLNRMNVAGQKPFNGVKYQYRVRSWDGKYTNSGWTNPMTLNVAFIAPTPPTSYTWNVTSIKKDESFVLSWTGATGGSGNITKYEADFRYYEKINNTWSSYKKVYTGSVPSYQNSLDSLFPNAKNGDKIQIRVRTNNSWGVWSSYSSSSQLLIKASQIWIKRNGQWVEGVCYIKKNGSWIEGTPYIKINNSWKENA